MNSIDFVGSRAQILQLLTDLEDQVRGANHASVYVENNQKGAPDVNISFEVDDVFEGPLVVDVS